MLRSNLVHCAEPHKGLRKGHHLSPLKIRVCMGLQMRESYRSLFTEQLDPKIICMIY